MADQSFAFRAKPRHILGRQSRLQHCVDFGQVVHPKRLTVACRVLRIASKATQRTSGALSRWLISFGHCRSYQPMEDYANG